MYFLIQFVSVSFDVFYWMMIARVLLSWVAPRANNRLAEFVIDVTDYVLIPIRKFIPTNVGGVDFSPILAIFLLNFLKRLVISLLLQLM
ncbi:MAG: YggT family protein [Clostridia bacterium]|nr:YggT family protein [Clostridia bacterium]